MEELDKLVRSKWFSIIYVIGAILLVVYLKDDFSKIFFYYVSLFLAIRLLANKKWIQLTVFTLWIIAVTVGVAYLKLRKLLL
ncbi:hypothetical protein [Clostridium folliculivorans]|uniref:Uncharacterized protein n=1 Tax=Clostridium folliculivorans TaxID=2886038 RepID=A0A9W5XY24_9CLOT|nr:hypothetical protein [Clostridium folliculivorans]GKU23211.1 hypothetical protein CFOLD11_00370 [Clostridium folliculivorans]GKU29257.1 hypothetical protein CFB3_13630 [Clostridium folliculivorans]